MASAKEYKGCTEVSGVSKLLQMVCQRFCKDSKVVTWDDEEGDKVELGREAVKGIWEVKEEIYNRTSFGKPRLG